MWSRLWLCRPLLQKLSSGGVGIGFRTASYSYSYSYSYSHSRSYPLPLRAFGGFGILTINGITCESVAVPAAPAFHSYYFCNYSYYSSDAYTYTAQEKEKEKVNEIKNEKDQPISYAEAKRLMRLVNVEALKKKLDMEGKEVIGYGELVDACQSMGVARSFDEAVAFARLLDEAGVVLLFRDKVYLHPDKVVDLVRRAVPIALTPEDDPVRIELKNLQEKKVEIDVLAHRQVRRILWLGLGMSVLQIGLFFRLTFWEFSWDVMEPIAFFVTTTGIIVGYAYFLFTSRDPTYQDLMKRLFLSRQRKLFKKYNFDVDRFMELQKKCKSPFDTNTSLKDHTGLELELEDALHKK